MALNAPKNGAAITAGSGGVAKVCGDIRHVCTVAVGDFNVSPEQSYEDRWAQLIGPAEAPKLYSTGQPHAKLVTNLAIAGAMQVGQGLPLPEPYTNVTGMQPAMLMDTLLPCQHPGPFPKNGCTV